MTFFDYIVEMSEGVQLTMCLFLCMFMANWSKGLLVVSSKDDQPINRFVDLFNTDQLPSLLNDGAMDPKILKHYLLLHDNQDGSIETY